MAETIRRRHAMVVLKVLVMLGLGRVLMLGMLLKVVKHIWHSSARPIQPGIMPLLMVLGVHAVESVSQQTRMGLVEEACGHTTWQRELVYLIVPAVVSERI